MNRSHRDTIALRRASLQTLAAIASRGGAFYDAMDLYWEGGSLPAHVENWTAPIRAAACATYAEACARSAFAIEADDASGTFRGYRLIRLGGGPSKTGQRYSGETFRDADTLWSVMRTIEDLATHPACAVETEARPTLHVSGIRWFSRAKGHTYHRAIVVYNGRTIADTAIAYGYGDQFLCTAAEACEAAGVIARKRYAESGAIESLRAACERLGIAFSCDVRDVSRRVDLGKPSKVQA